MAILSFTLSEEGVSAFRDALICLNKFSDDVSLEARKDSFVLTTLNSSKSAYASFKFATNRFFSKYQCQPMGQFRDRFYCTLYIRVGDSLALEIISTTTLSALIPLSLISLFRSRSSSESQRDAEKQTLIDRCDITVEDGEGIKSRFIARIVFRNGLTSTHRLPFEVAVPVHAKFNRQDAPHHWTISSRTLRQLMDHFGPGIEYLDINTDGDHVNFTCFSEKTVNEDAVLKKPLQTSIAVETDEFDDIDVEDKLHVVISVKDFRAIVQHAGITGNAISARYSLPAKPILLSYVGDALACEFLIMTVGERGSNPAQKTKKGRKATAAAASGPRLEAASRRTSVAPNETTTNIQPYQLSQSAPSIAKPTVPNPTPHPHISAARASASRIGAFDLRPSQKPPPPTIRSESLFVDDDGWEPVRDEEEDVEQDARLEWDHSADPNPSALQLSRIEERHAASVGRQEAADAQTAPESTYLEPTQKLSDVKSLALFPD
ncbi:DNA repair protein rad9 [Metarhizium brunneum]|uniref:DNA repair protein rad9 n=1 Tax=Metarhizium brunneum TaxID=500148 RepID=A0A7D5Z6W8_9HYPO|nr:DNA repair protein rad9 [Metarhizium brunneum]